jgi:hypothetical protein
MFRIPGFLGFLESEACLSAFRALTILFLAAGAAGFLTRVAIPLATVCSVFYVAIFVDYTYFFHQWLIGTYVVAAVAVTPCGDALSLDAWLRHRAGKPPVQRPAAVYAWSRYLCWTALALPYFYAGLSKLRNGGWMWWDPLNLRGKVVRDTLQKGVFEPPWGLEFFTAPDALFGAIGILTLIFEVGFILVLFSPHARRILPLGAAAMHLGILVLQNFIFVDALLMQAIFFDWRRLGERVRSQIGSIAPALPEAPTPAASRAYGSRASYAALVIGLVWLLRIEAYPLSSWGMYSGTRLESSIAYHVTWAQHATLGRIPAPYERCFPAPAFNPYIRMAAYAFGGPAEQDASRKFFSACAMELNRGKPAAERISAFRVEQWQWDWNADPPGPPYGALLDAKVWPVASREGARQPLLD